MQQLWWIADSNNSLSFIFIEYFIVSEWFPHGGFYEKMEAFICIHSVCYTSSFLNTACSPLNYPVDSCSQPRSGCCYLSKYLWTLVLKEVEWVKWWEGINNLSMTTLVLVSVVHDILIHLCLHLVQYVVNLRRRENEIVKTKDIFFLKIIVLHTAMSCPMSFLFNSPDTTFCWTVISSIACSKLDIWEYICQEKVLVK